VVQEATTDPGLAVASIEKASKHGSEEAAIL